MKNKLIKACFYLFPIFGFFFQNLVKADEVKIKLKDGSQINGTLNKEQSDSLFISIDNPNLGVILIPVDSVIKNESNKEIIDQLEEIEEELIGEKLSSLFISRWRNSINVGLTSSFSKSRESNSFSFLTNTEYNGIFNDYILSTSYQFNEITTNSIDVFGNNSGNIDFEKDRRLNKKFFIGNTFHYRFNDMSAAGKHRFEKAFGIGFYPLKKDRITLKTFFGPAAILHTGGQFCPSIKHCGELFPGFNSESYLEWQINNKLSFKFSDVYTFATSHNLVGSNYLRASLNFRPYLDKSLNISLNFVNSQYEFTSSEKTNNVTFMVGRSF
tara:strand:+ start:15 stop:995 length:981 start_codon:yes stop_codon:yes gene_type:complete